MAEYIFSPVEPFSMISDFFRLLFSCVHQLRYRFTAHSIEQQTCHNCRATEGKQAATFKSITFPALNEEAMAELTFRFLFAAEGARADVGRLGRAVLANA
mmetsp:Transcript_17517/g.34198  ORF Transcript_17517/g.34198 Transcript_17517/m.34198 type:complete len:100 (+) Transcript_17517:218-517(+)